MSQTLKIKLTEADHPVGVPRLPRYTLPPESHVYGLKIRRDPEGVSTGKFILYLLLINLKQLHVVGKCMNHLQELVFNERSKRKKVATILSNRENTSFLLLTLFTV